MNKNDGNPAFPAPEAGIARFGEGNADAFMGMSLRDYFAAKAMQGMFSNDALLSRYHNDGLVNMISPEVLAVTAAYSMADAMLAERAK